MTAMLRDPGAGCFPLAIWGLASAWVLGYDTAISLSFLLPWAIGVLPLSILGLGLRAAMTVVAAAGILLAAGPYLFGYAAAAGTGPVLSSILTGILIAALALLSAHQGEPAL